MFGSAKRDVGSPGAMCITKKVIREIPINKGINWINLLIIYFFIISLSWKMGLGIDAGLKLVLVLGVGPTSTPNFH